MESKTFYPSSEISPDLAIIEQHREAILQEVNNIYRDKWMPWPGHELQKEHVGWTIYPFCGFGIWDDEACSSCPVLADCLRRINGLRLASLSKLEGNTKTNRHYGCKGYADTVIRCHYGLIVPPLSCSVTVVQEDGREVTSFHAQFEFLCFDDSRLHCAENRSNQDRIILIVDVDRPSHIERGLSRDGDSAELQQVLDHFRRKNAM